MRGLVRLLKSHAEAASIPKTSAGLLASRWRDGRREVFLIHPGDPFRANKDAHAWSVAKGEVEQDEELLDAARREFAEETGLTMAGTFLPLTPMRQASGKLVHVWAIEADTDPSSIRRNLFPLEWPPRSGQFRSRRLTAPAGSIPLRLRASSTRDRLRLLGALEQKLSR